MPQSISYRNPVVDWLTVAAITTIAISINVSFHEGIHALTCLTVGGSLHEYSALYVSCDTSTIFQSKLVAGSAPVYNIIVGSLFFLIVRNSRKQSSEVYYFLWLFMLMNWLYGAGYFMFSGFFNVGDIATVINDWEPSWLWHGLTIIVGSFLYLFFVWLSLLEFGKMIGGYRDEQIKRATKLGILSFFTSFIIIFAAGFFSPTGLLSLPVIAGIIAVIGGLSPLLWMMQWFRSEKFVKYDKEPLEIHRKWNWLVIAGIVVFIYIFVLGQTFYS